MRYSTLLFDADETLMDFRRAEQLALTDVLRRHNLPTDEQFLSVYHAINDSLWEQYNCGQIPKSEITSTRFVRLFAHFCVALDGVAFNERYLDCLSEHGDLLPGAKTLCETLYRAGFSMYIITNGIGRVQKSRFERSGLSPYFKDIFISEAIGVGKPHKAFFDHVLSAVPDSDPARTLVIGDSLSADIAGGCAAGLDTCWCDFRQTDQPNDATYRVTSFAQLQALLTGGTS